MDKKAIIKNNLITAIKEKGFPIGYVENEADSYAGFFIDKDGKITTLGYASDFMSDKVADLNKVALEDLGIVELAKLLENGSIETDEEFKYVKETVDQEIEMEE